MQITDLITALEKIKAEKGDIEVVFETDNGTIDVEFVYTNKYGQPLAVLA